MIDGLAKDLSFDKGRDVATAFPMTWASSASAIGTVFHGHSGRLHPDRLFVQNPRVWLDKIHTHKGHHHLRAELRVPARHEAHQGQGRRRA